MGKLFPNHGTWDIDEEYQEWVLIGVTVAGIFCICCPCLWPARSCSCLNWCFRRVRRRALVWVLVWTVVTVLALEYATEALPNWTLGAYCGVIGARLGWFIKNLQEFLLSICVIVVAAIVFALRIHILKALGFDHMTLVRFSMSTFLCCGEASYRPIEVAILKVEGLRSAKMMRPNDLFFEFHLAFNEVNCTRVMYAVGEDCVVRQTTQLNFDENDGFYDLTVLAKHQDIVGSEEVARCVFNTDKILDLLSVGGSDMGWSESDFQAVSLQPQGQMWVRISDVSQDEEQQQTMMTRLLGR